METKQSLKTSTMKSLLLLFVLLFGFISAKELIKYADDDLSNQTNIKYLKASCVGLSTCTYSIGLYSSEISGRGWAGSTINVFVDNTKVVEDKTLVSGYGPEWYNFPVSDSSIIKIAYYSTIEGNSDPYYKVATEANGGGLIVYTSTFQFLYNVQNPCTDTAGCTFTFTFNGYGPTDDNFPQYGFSIFVNGTAIEENIFMENKNSGYTINFDVKPEDFIQVKCIGGPFVFNSNIGFTYFFFYPYDEGGIVYADFATDGEIFSGEIQPPNYCGKTDLKLVVSEPTEPVNGVIPMTVLPSYPARTPFQVILTLRCASGDTNQTRLSSTDSTNFINFLMPVTYAEPCYFIASVNDSINYPYADSEYVPLSGCELQWITPVTNEIIYSGKNVIKISSSCDDLLIVNLLAYDGSIITYSNIIPNVDNLVDIPKVSGPATLSVVLFDTDTMPNPNLSIVISRFKSPFSVDLQLIPIDQYPAVARSNLIKSNSFFKLTENGGNI